MQPPILATRMVSGTANKDGKNRITKLLDMNLIIKILARYPSAILLVKMDDVLILIFALAMLDGILLSKTKYIIE